MILDYCEYGRLCIKLVQRSCGYCKEHCDERHLRDCILLEYPGVLGNDL